MAFGARSAANWDAPSVADAAARGLEAPWGATEFRRTPNAANAFDTVSTGALVASTAGASAVAGALDVDRVGRTDSPAKPLPVALAIVAALKGADTHTTAHIHKPARTNKHRAVSWEW